MLLFAAGRLVERALEQRLAGEGLSVRHAGVLGHLRRSPGMSYSELARRSEVSVQAMHTTVGRLVERGLVTTVDHARGAAATLEVTPAGGRALAVFRDHLAALDADLADVDLDLGELGLALRVLGGAEPGSPTPDA
jgi:DNA-binding MarR family transcriptional regulator